MKVRMKSMSCEFNSMHLYKWILTDEFMSTIDYSLKRKLHCYLDSFTDLVESVIITDQHDS